MENTGPHTPTPGGPAPANDPVFVRITQAIARTPDLDPPQELLPRVMEALGRRRVPWWRRLKRWALSPKTFTLTPVRAVPVAALSLATVAVAIFGLLRGNPPAPVPPGHAAGVPVVFYLDRVVADSVSVIGSFNHWNADGAQMVWDPRQGRWHVELRLPRGRHEYAFLVDGRRVLPDPHAVFHQEDGFGNRNAILIVGNGHDNET